MVNLFLKNVGNSVTQVSLYTGGGLTLKPSECKPINETCTPGLEKFYAQLRPVDIILIKVNSGKDEEPIEEPQTTDETPIEEEDTSGETSIEEEDDEEESVEEEETPVEETFEGLMKFRLAELVNLAKERGIEIASGASKKEICHAILGDA